MCTQATLIILSPLLLKHGMASIDGCLVDEVCRWSEDKDNPRDKVGGSTADELELDVILLDTSEALGCETGTEIIPEPTISMGYTGIIGNPFMLKVSGVAAGHTGFERDI